MPTEPPVGETMAVLTPTTWPSMLKIGPPELPGLIGASSCRKSSNGPAPMSRPRAETMPAVTEPPRPNGLPAARTQSPTSTWRQSPQATAGSGPVACHLDDARRRSARRCRSRLAGSSVPSVSETTILSAWPTTWLLVTMMPGRVDDEARTGAHRLFLAIAEAAAELAPERRVAQFGRQLGQQVAAGHGLGDRDVHHRRQHLLDQRREAVGRRAGDGAAGHRRCRR